MLTLSSSFSFGAEADNFIAQKLNLPDQSLALNDLANRYLENVLVAANASASYCNEDVLNRALKQVFANHTRGLFVKDILKQTHFPVEYVQRADSIYSEWKLHNGLILAMPLKKLKEVGLSPLIKVGDVNIGVDKLEHMFGMGAKYYGQYYNEKKSITKVLSNGVVWEKTILGGNVVATGVFSYGDLSANFNGMRFWNHMLLKNDDILGSEYNRGPYVLCEGNKWVSNKNQKIDFRNYVDFSFDESVNCSKFATRNGKNKVQKAVSAKDYSDIVKCTDNHETLSQLNQKYSPQGINNFILNNEGIGKVRYFNEIR